MKQRKVDLGTTHNLNTLSETDSAWLAAFIDGEGSIMIYRSNPKDQYRPYYGIRISVTNTHVETMEHVHRMVGAGTMAFRKKQDKKWKDALIWIVQGDTAAALLLQIKPHLVTKRAQAEVALRFARLKRERRLDGVDNLDEQAALYDECKKLNGRGKKHQRYQIKANLKAQPKRTCGYENCNEVHYGRGYCRKHWRWIYESKVFQPDRKCAQCDEPLSDRHRAYAKYCSKRCAQKAERLAHEAAEPMRFCEVDSCPRRHHADGLCRAHYMQRFHAQRRGEHWEPDKARRTIRQCTGCGTILPEGVNPRQKFCGHNCYHRHYYRTRRKAA